MTAPVPERRLRSISDSAEYLDVHPITIRRMIRDGRIKAYRIPPKLLKVDLNELDELLSEISTAGAGDAA